MAVFWFVIAVAGWCFFFITAEAYGDLVRENRSLKQRLEGALAALVKAKTAASAFDLFRERRAGIDRTRAEIQALPELGDGAS